MQGFALGRNRIVKGGDASVLTLLKSTATLEYKQEGIDL